MIRIFNHERTNVVPFIEMNYFLQIKEDYEWEKKKETKIVFLYN